MNKVYQDDYPETLFDAFRVISEIRDEDIDYSDIPPLGDDVIVTPIGRKFIEMGRRNLERINAEKAHAL